MDAKSVRTVLPVVVLVVSFNEKSIVYHVLISKLCNMRRVKEECVHLIEMEREA